MKLRFPEGRRAKQLRRIMYYERLMVSMREKPTRAAREALRRYYESPAGKRDFLADEAGLLPRGLRRGVLSEDGLYDLLAETEELA